MSLLFMVCTTSALTCTVILVASRSFLRHKKRTRRTALSILRFITSPSFLDGLKVSHNRQLKKQCRSQVSLQISHLPIAGFGIAEAFHTKALVVSAHGGTVKCAFQTTFKLSLQRKNADYLTMTLLEDVQTQHSTVDP